MPDSTAFQVAFDAVRDFRASAYGNQALAALVLAGLVIGLAFGFGWHRKHQVPLWLIAGMALTPAVVCGLALALSYLQLTHLRNALDKGRFAVVQGVVTSLQPGDGHRSETFEVGGHRYEYSSSSRSVGFNRDAAVGGPIRNGLPVRITDVGGEIARLEIAQ